jgi:hypothetical protein
MSWIKWTAIGLTTAIILWGGIALVSYASDSQARHYAATATTTPEVAGVPRQEPSFWPYFFWGYMLGGNNGYTQYRTVTNTYYQQSPQYQAQQAAPSRPSGTWGAVSPSASPQPAPAPSKPANSWGSGSSGSWGTSGSSGSSWSSGGKSGSWGSGGSGSSWSSGSSRSSGSWGKR